jgi:hypothetical protein
MPPPTRAKSTPSLVSDEITVVLRCEVKRLRKLQRQRGLEGAELGQLLAIGAAMRELEDNRMSAMVDILGYRFKTRDVPDDVLQPLLAALTGEEAK